MNPTENYVPEEMITLCGDNCLDCPRYLAKTEEELAETADLWYRMGWRDKVVSNEEIRCTGCTSHKECTYHLVECTKEHGVEKCRLCLQFPCDKSKDMLDRSKEYERKSRAVCTAGEYRMLKAAFFNKEENLKK